EVLSFTSEDGSMDNFDVANFMEARIEPFSPGVKVPKGQSDEHGPPCAVRNLASTRGCWYRSQAIGDMRPTAHPAQMRPSCQLA
uniref:hypothetical protein n=1 Tax=Stenotrophomonas maltophilia TaxID=40324 RepID=UPI0039C2BA65